MRSPDCQLPDGGEDDFWVGIALLGVFYVVVFLIGLAVMIVKRYSGG